MAGNAPAILARLRLRRAWAAVAGILVDPTFHIIVFLILFAFVVAHLPEVPSWIP